MDINYKKFIYISLITFIIPINIYVIGDFLGAGIAFPLFKFQITFLGTSVLTLIKELNYVINGTFHHNTAISVIFWTIGVIGLFLSLIFLIINRNKNINSILQAGILIFISTFMFLISIFFQYSPFFHGPSGTAIPVGLPVMFIISVWMIMEGKNQESENGDNEDLEE